MPKHPHHPHHPDIPPHHPHGLHHRPRGWIFHDSKFTSRGAAAQVLQALGEVMAEHSRIEFGSNEFSVPEELRVEVVHERTPHGTKVLRVHLEWDEEISEHTDRSDVTFRAARTLRGPEADDE